MKRLALALLLLTSCTKSSNSYQRLYDCQASCSPYLGEIRVMQDITEKCVCDLTKTIK